MWPSSRKGCSWGPRKRKAEDAIKIHLKGERGPREKREGSRENNTAGGGGGGSEKEGI